MGSFLVRNNGFNVIILSLIFCNQTVSQIPGSSYFHFGKKKKKKSDVIVALS